MAELEVSGKLGPEMADEYTKFLLRELFATSDKPESIVIQAKSLAALGTIPNEVCEIIATFVQKVTV
jgi:5-methylthioribose kinase